jgi:hypothetical protein
MKNKIIAILTFVFIAGGLAVSQNQPKKFYFPKVDWATGWAGGFKVGTLGPGLEAVKSVNDNWNARAGFSFLPFAVDREITISNLGLDISTKNRLGGVNLQADFFFKPWFYFTGGLLVNLIHSKMYITLTDTVDYGDIPITPGQVGSLTANVRPGWIVSPFLGVGLGNAMPVNKKVWFNVELGAIYGGKPHFRLEADGMVSPTASAENEKALKTAFKGFRFYPMFSAQVNYRIR